MLRIRQPGGPDRHVDQHAIRIRRIVPEKELVRLRMEVGDLALDDRQARVHVDAIGLHPADRVRAGVANQDVAVFAARRLVDERAQFAVVESLVALEHRRDLADLHRRLLLRVRLDLEDVDGMPHAGAVRVADEDAVAGDAEPAAVARAVEVAALPGPGRRILDRRHREHPVQMLEVAEQVQIFLELRGARPGVFLRRGRIDLALPVDAHRRHLAIGVSNVLGWQPAGSFEKSTH